MKKKKKTFKKLMKTVNIPQEEYETIQEMRERFESYLPNCRERMLKKGNLLLSMKIKGIMYYKLATGHKKEKKWVIKALLQYKKRVAGAKQKGRRGKAQTRYNRVLEIIREKKLLDEEIIKDITEGGVKWIEEYLTRQDWTHELTEEQKKDSELIKTSRLFDKVMDEANEKVAEFRRLTELGLPGAEDLRSGLKVLARFPIIISVMDEWEDAKDSDKKLKLEKRLIEEQKKFIKVAGEAIKDLYKLKGKED